MKRGHKMSKLIAAESKAETEHREEVQASSAKPLHLLLIATWNVPCCPMTAKNLSHEARDLSNVGGQEMCRWQISS